MARFLFLPLSVPSRDDACLAELISFLEDMKARD